MHVDLGTSAVSVQDGEICGTLIPERDTLAVFDGSRRVLRLPIVLRNAGTRPVMAPARVSFSADSIYRWRNGQRVPGAGSTRSANADSSNATGRESVWRYDTLLAGAGQLQEIAPGARSQRLWLEFTGPELWLQTGGADADTTLSLRLDASAILGAERSIVPAVPPDSQPAGMFDPSNVVYDSATIGGPILRDIISLVFQESATQGQRQALIDSVAGTVVGGALTSPTSGYYYVRLAAIQTVAQLHSIIARLAASPYVDAASVILAVDVPGDYLRPRDGAGWSLWNANPAFVGAGKREALERLYAPLAWGCSGGRSDVPVAVVDIDFRPYTDLPFNSTLSRGVGTVPTTVEHGSRVASILGATGNNNTGMIGVMWKSDLRLYERTIGGRASAQASAARAALAIQHGARVVNLSFSLAQAWSTSAGAPLQWHGGNRADSSFALAYAQLYAD
ncbi:MAG: S8 family serine peptidase, partial [Gemmatimonadaceae bacterium]